MQRITGECLSTRHPLCQSAVNFPPHGAGSRQKDAEIHKRRRGRGAENRRVDARERRGGFCSTTGKKIADEPVGESARRRLVPQKADVISGKRAEKTGVQNHRRRL